MAQTLTRPALAYLDAAPKLPVLALVALRVAVVLAKWSERARTRRALADLDGHLLRDVGLDPLTAKTESQRPFWQG